MEVTEIIERLNDYTHVIHDVLDAEALREGLVLLRRDIPAEVEIEDIRRPMCPVCKRTLNDMYQYYCSNCGQELIWDNYLAERKRLFDVSH